jgi:hypothetical protein
MSTTDFQLSIWPDSNLVSAARRFLEEVYEKVFTEDHDMVGRIALTVHELLENAVKYSSAGNTSLSVAIEPGETSDQLTITVSNPAHLGHLTTLRTTLAEIAAARSPFEYYLQLMRRNGRRDEGSGLGLARISAEAEMSLTCEHTAGRVCVFARTDLQKRSGS